MVADLVVECLSILNPHGGLVVPPGSDHGRPLVVRMLVVRSEDVVIPTIALIAYTTLS